MGAGTSHIDKILQDVATPLRTTPKMEKSLDIMSLIVARILSTPDIYDLNNLKKEGVCGDYIVLLKEQLMKSEVFMPYHTVSGEDILYQSPDKLIPNPETRKRVCKELAESALSIVAIVVSCLASIQISTKTREQIVTDILPKTGAPLMSARPYAPPAYPTTAYPRPAYPAAQAYPSVQAYPGPAFPGLAYPTAVQAYPTAAQAYPSPVYPAAPAYPAAAQAYPSAPAYPAAAQAYPATPAYPSYGQRQIQGPVQGPRYNPYQYGYAQAQQGAGRESSIKWLIENKYIKIVLEQEFDIIDTTINKTHSFKLYTTNSDTLYKDISPGLTADIVFIPEKESSSGLEGLKGCSVIIQFLDPITNPYSAKESIMPVRILDAAGVGIFVGVLHNGYFKSLSESSIELDLPGILFLMFRLSMKDNQLTDEMTKIRDTTEQMTRTNQLFESAKYDPSIILRIMSSYLSDKSTSYQGSQYNSARGYPGTGVVPSIAGKPTQIYSIPSSAAFSIMQTLETYKTKLSIDSCPAMIRTKSLLDELTSKHSIRTRFCSDIYWSQTNLSKIYPYTTLQFLCISDWSSPSILDKEFRVFCQGLVDIYDKYSGFAPKLIIPGAGSVAAVAPAVPVPTVPVPTVPVPTVPVPTVPETAVPAVPSVPGSGTVSFGFLDAMRFDSASYEVLKKKYCMNGPLLSEPKYLADIIQQLNAEFAQHITAVLKIIDSLIIVIKDPDTNTYVSRLSPEITSRKRSTKTFIAEQRKNAISLISNHYIRVEQLYLEGMKTTIENTTPSPPPTQS